MKKAILLFLCFCSVCNAQNKQIDSLLEVLKTAKADTIKANTLNALTEELIRKADYETAINYAHDALQLSESINYKKGESEVYYNIGDLHYNQGHYPEALKSYLKSLKISEEIADKLGIANAHYVIGNVYSTQGDSPEMLKHFLISLKIYEEIGNKRGIANCYISARNVGTYEDALKYLFSALKIYKEINDKAGMANCYEFIARHYSVLNNASEAEKNYQASLKIAEEIGDKRTAALDYSNISSVYLDQKNYSEALRSVNKALKINQELRDKQGILSSYYCLGNIYARLKDFPEANKYLSAALSLSKEIGTNLNTMGIYRDLAELDSASGNYKQAIADFRVYDHYRNVLNDETGMKNIRDMKAKYESEKNEKEISLLTKDNEIKKIEINKQKLQKYSFIGGLTLVILLLLLGYRVYRSRQMLHLQNIRNKIAGDLHDDIGSTLNSISIYSEVAKNNETQRDEALEMIGDGSRKIIDVMSDIVWTINPENDSFAKIIFRMKSLAHNLLRAKNIEYTFHADEALDEKKISLEDRRNFYLIFKEAINNLVKYAEANVVAITLSNENGRMKLSIRDNGIGFDTSKENAGNGLKSMKRRADEMKATFNIESEKGKGTQIELILSA